MATHLRYLLVREAPCLVRRYEIFELTQEIVDGHAPTVSTGEGSPLSGASLRNF
jgi:hypothetical protein